MTSSGKHPKHQLSRRTVLAGAAALAFARIERVGALAAGQVAGVEMPTIMPRSEWDDGRAPTGPLEPEDVKFLLVHHTAEPGNDYEAEDVVPMLQSIYRYHTSETKGWPDIAYNFIIDKFGRIFEARAGSIAGPIRGSATGGNQGYSQLCCFLGDLAVEPPTDEAQKSMISLLTWLADRYAVPVGSGQKVEFTSLGSNRWPEGTPISLDPISAHRDVSQTTCPGDACMDLVRVAFPNAVAERLMTTTTVPEPTTTTASTTTTQPAVTESTESAPDADTQQGPRVASSDVTSGPSTLAPETATGPSPSGDDGGLPIIESALGAVAAAGVGLAIVASKRQAGQSPADDPQKTNRNL